MEHQGKTCTNTQGASSSINSYSDCKCGNKEKTQSDNQWISESKTHDCGCGCK